MTRPLQKMEAPKWRGCLPTRALKPPIQTRSPGSSVPADPIKRRPEREPIDPFEEDGNPADMAAVPGEDADPNAWPGDPQEEPQDWVQVLVSGAGMHGTASEDAPALFSFPYGRTLRVVSRYEGWVEVTDPQSAATGWMKAQYLAPVAAPRSPGETEAMYDDDDEYGDEPPRRRRGWLRRHGGGFGDMLNRALGGGY